MDGLSLSQWLRQTHFQKKYGAKLERIHTYVWTEYTGLTRKEIPGNLHINVIIHLFIILPLILFVRYEYLFSKGHSIIEICLNYLSGPYLSTKSSRRDEYYHTSNLNLCYINSVNINTATAKEM